MEEKGNGYVALRVSDKSSKLITEVLGSYGITDLINNFHMTMMFDEGQPNIETSSNASYNVTPTNIDMLGDLDSKYRAIVLKFKSVELDARFAELVKLGYKHSYDTFVAHVSIKYGPSESDIKTIMDNKKDIIDRLGVIVLGNEYIEAIDKPD